MKVGIIGVGKMGGAILNGIVSSNYIKKEDILLSVRRPEQKEELEKLGYKVTLNPISVYEESDIIVLSVKPQMAPECLKESINYDFKNKAVLSVMAGIKISKLEEMFKNALIVRTMPNTSALIGKSVSTIVCNDKMNPLYKDTYEIMESIGDVIEIDEVEMDTTLPLNGSMPAYIYYFIKAFVDSAMESGMEYDKAFSLVTKTIISSTIKLTESEDSIQDEIDKVCSKGGTTIAGLNKLIENKVDESIKECYNACKNRSIELGK